MVIRLLSVIEPEIQGHHQAGQQRQGAAGRLVSGADGHEPAEAEDKCVAQSQDHGH